MLPGEQVRAVGEYDIIFGQALLGGGGGGDDEDAAGAELEEDYGTVAAGDLGQGTIEGFLEEQRTLGKPGLSIRSSADPALIRLSLEWLFQWQNMRTLEGRPWTFDKNLLIINPIQQDSNPTEICLDWCPFTVFVHDLPLSQHTRAMAKHIGNKIGIFLDIELPENGLVWSSTLKLRVSLDVSKPLKSALRLFSAQGIEKLVTLTYNRLPNFCYLCGCLGHIAKFCPKCYKDDFIDPGESLPYGPWLRENNQPKAQTLHLKPHFSRPEYSSDSGRKDAQIRGLRIVGDFTGSKLGSDSPMEGKNSATTTLIRFTQSQDLFMTNEDHPYDPNLPSSPQFHLPPNPPHDLVADPSHTNTPRNISPPTTLTLVQDHITPVHAKPIYDLPPTTIIPPTALTTIPPIHIHDLDPHSQFNDTQLCMHANHATEISPCKETYPTYKTPNTHTPALSHRVQSSLEPTLHNKESNSTLVDLPLTLYDPFNLGPLIAKSKPKRYTNNKITKRKPLTQPTYTWTGKRKLPLSFFAFEEPEVWGPWTIRHLRELDREYNPPPVFLIETECKSRKLDNVRRILDMHGLGVDAIGKSGSLALLWNKKIHVDLLNFSQGHIDARILLSEDDCYWHFTGFYGSPNASKRSTSWDLLRRLSTISNLPWLCAGDFNAILSRHREREL
ncbi:UNVERIFIED_CONTAM: hypothetical protein Scaly_1598900 [Sesamum calycinum]|uniref:CCHC-type domain-containing protein n=1 Tax=Sesamum calycinum TaxID=2727403 RepID=A0AAW2P877_9LAMI